MAERHIEILFDEPGRAYESGDAITGKVRVRVEKPTRCNGLMIFQAWYTHGKGNESEGHHDVLHLFEGDWGAGVHEYPFEFEAQSGPYTYHGRYLNLDWYLLARADVPWAFDPKDEQDFTLAPPADGIDQVPMLGEVSARAAQRDLVESLAPWGKLLVALMATLIGGAFGVYGLVAGDVGFMGFGVISGAFAVGSALVGFYGLAGRRTLGQVEYDLPEKPCAPGAMARVGVHFTPRAGGQLSSISMTLRGFERVVSGSGTDAKTYTHDFYTQPLELSDAITIKAGERVDLEVLVPIPEDAPSSFASADNELGWALDLHVDITRWPDYKETRRIVVGPAPKPGATW